MFAIFATPRVGAVLDLNNVRHQARFAFVIHADFETLAEPYFNVRGSHTHSHRFDDALNQQTLHKTTSEANHALHMHPAFWAYVRTHGRVLPKIAPQQAAISHARLTSAHELTPVRRLHLDGSLSLLRVPAVHNSTCALFPAAFQATLQAAEQSLNVPAVQPRMPVGVSTTGIGRQKCVSTD